MLEEVNKENITTIVLLKKNYYHFITEGFLNAPPPFLILPNELVFCRKSVAFSINSKHVILL
jgi:hypothetical protein